MSPISFCLYSTKLFFTLLVRKNLYLKFLYNKFFSIYNYLFRFFCFYSVFNEQFRELCSLGGDDGIRFSRELRARSSTVANVHRKFALYRFPFESGFVSNSHHTISVTWWRWWDSNPWPPACRAGALPAELHPHIGFCCFSIFLQTVKVCLVGPSGLEPPLKLISRFTREKPLALLKGS